MKREGPTIRRGKSKQDYATPWELIHACHSKFGQIDYDLAADDTNAKAYDYFTVKDNALVKSWHDIRFPIIGGGLARPSCFWLNPPFDNIAPWAKKCLIESEAGAQILFLTPASVGANWFRDYVHGKAKVFALNGRITFVGATQPYPKDCMISAFGFGSPGFDVWTWGSKA